MQWLRLPESECREADGINVRAMENLARAQAVPMNENYAIASSVAAAAGLERVYSVDEGNNAM